MNTCRIHRKRSKTNWHDTPGKDPRDIGERAVRINTDPIENDVAVGLHKRGVGYDYPDNGLDFYLPDFDVHIECKQFYTDRITDQLQRADNVIVVQGKKAAKFLREILEEHL